MAISTATSGFGTLLKAGDGAVGDGVKAFVEWGTGDAKIRIRWKVAGTVGNGKNITVVVSGASYVYTTLDSTAISITVPTTATVAQVIANLYQQANFALYWEADFGASPGDGSDTITARTVTPTASGAEGTEVFTTIAEIKSLSGPNFQTAFAEVTHMESPDAVREFIPTLIDAGEISFTANFLPDNATHDSIRTDLLARTKRNFKMFMTDAGGATVWSFSGYYSQLQLNTSIDAASEVTIGVKITSTIVES